MADLGEVDKVVISKVIPLGKPWNYVIIDLKLNLIQLLCLNTLNTDHFPLKTKYFVVAE